MNKLSVRSMGMAALLVAAMIPARAQFTPIPLPDAWYLTNTTLLPTPATFPASVLTDGSFSVTFSSPADMYRFTPGGGWATWNTPPWVEPTPTDVFFTGVTSLTMTFSRPVTTFGFEAEPNPLDVYNMSAVFYYSGSPVGTITLPVDGNGGARLFAATGTLFDQVVFSSTVDFAVGRLRYGDTSPDVIPEAGTLASFGSMAGLGLLWLRRRFAA